MHQSAEVGEVLLETRGLTKVFGTTTACDAINLKINRGEIHALLGENGAGKSTLVKMLFGSLEPSAGEVLWHGKSLNIRSPFEARKLGIGMVFQHFSLFDALTAAENIALALPDRTPVAKIASQARNVSVSYGLPVDPGMLVGDLSVGERQRIEIIRCLLQEPELIILDEPTSVLTPQEADRLFQTLERLKAEGKSILYISHRLDEVKRICDSATVLRHGKVIRNCNPKKETAASLARMMVGDTIKVVQRQGVETATADGPLLEIRSLTREPLTPFSIKLRDINFTVRAGEVFGIAGVAGNGQGELFEAISGEAIQADPDSVRISGQSAGLLSISRRRLLGAAFVPEERLGHGTVPTMTLSENLLLSRHRTDRASFFKRLGVISPSNIRAISQRIIDAMDVRKGAPDPEAAALSGGNLQKFIVGRELDRKPSVIVINQPTWGVDAGAAARIRQALISLAQAGSAVLIISQDLDELFEMADALAVMHDGQLSKPIARNEATTEAIGLLMGGLNPGHADHREAAA